MKFSEGKINPKVLEEGAWVDEIPEMEGVRFKVRGMFNSDWRKLDRKLTDLVPRKRRVSGRLDQEDQDRIMSECLFQTCLLDWDGLFDENDQPMPYSKEIAHQMLFEPENQRYRNAVIWAASTVVEQDNADKDDIVKN